MLMGRISQHLMVEIVRHLSFFNKVPDLSIMNGKNFHDRGELYFLMDRTVANPNEWWYIKFLDIYSWAADIVLILGVDQTCASSKHNFQGGMKCLLHQNKSPSSPTLEPKQAPKWRPEQSNETRWFGSDPPRVEFESQRMKSLYHTE